MPTNLSIEYPKLEAENQKLKRLLHDLTPGGSEFYNDPEYCAKWIKTNREEAHYILVGQIKEFKNTNEVLKDEKERLEAKNERLINTLTAILNQDRVNNNYADTCSAMKSKARAAIEANKP